MGHGTMNLLGNVVQVDIKEKVHIAVQRAAREKVIVDTPDNATAQEMVG